MGVIYVLATRYTNSRKMTPTLAFTGNNVYSTISKQNGRFRKLKAEQIQLNVKTRVYSYLNGRRLAVGQDIFVNLTLDKAENVCIIPNRTVLLISQPTAPIYYLPDFHDFVALRGECDVVNYNLDMMEVFPNRYLITHSTQFVLSKIKNKIEIRTIE